MSDWPDAAQDDANDSMSNRPPGSAKESCDDGREWDTVLEVDDPPEWETRLDIDESWDPHASTGQGDKGETPQDPD